MPSVKLQKRDHDFFASYGHGDVKRVTDEVEWLGKSCGLSLWFDATAGNAAQRSSELLTGGLTNSRGALFFVSAKWTESDWCKNEYEVALNEQRANAGFEIVAVRLDDSDPPAWFKVAELIDLSDAQNIGARSKLLRSLSSDVPHRFDNAHDVYLAAPWGRPSALARKALVALREVGWRLVGDSPNLKHLGVNRVQSIISTTRGVVALLPHDPEQPTHATSPYILQEAQIAAESGKPLLLLAEPGAAPPDALTRAAFKGHVHQLSEAATDKAALSALLEMFDDDLSHRAHDDTGAYVFFAGSLLGGGDEQDEIASVIQRASNLLCVRGQRLVGDNVQQAIIDRIRRAAVVIADVTDDHRNTLIETGIAMGCGTRLKLIAHAQGATPPKKRFMFEGQELHWYRSARERLGLCYWIARQFRRQVYVSR